MRTAHGNVSREVRHGRQSRLADVGAAGQARLAQATVRVRGVGFSGDVEARYLAGAGVGTLVVREATQAAAIARIDASTSVRAGDDARSSADDSQPTDETSAVPGPIAALGLPREAEEAASGALRALVSIRRALGIADEGILS